MVIDSEATVRTVTAKILQTAGHAVRAAGDLDEALTQLRASVPDLILTNVYLRGDITGHEAMTKLKGEFPEVPVLMVSGLPDEEIINEWIEQVGFDVFPKPFTSHSLINKVGQMLTKREKCA